jgi:hypothetical protein
MKTILITEKTLSTTFPTLSLQLPLKTQISIK